MIKLSRYSIFLVLFFSVSAFSSKAGNMPDLRNWGYNWEDYDSTLFYRLQSINDIISYADSIQGQGARQTRAYSEILASTIRKRFYHGYSYYSVQDNWIAWLAGTLVWNHLHAVVLPEDIMKYPNAACSQQAIVLKECFKEVGIDYREVNLTGHFVLEGKPEGHWLLFDTNMEPQFPTGRKSLTELIQSGELVTAYRRSLTPERIQKMFAHPVFREANAPIAPNATGFQQITGFLSFGFPLLLPLLLLVLILKKKIDPTAGNHRKINFKMLDSEEKKYKEEVSKV